MSGERVDVTKSGAEPGEQVEDLDALEHNVAAAAEAAATAAAHAVAAAKAAEEISRVRAEAEANVAEEDTDAIARSIATVATSKVEKSNETPDLTQPDLAPPAPDARTGPRVSTGQGASTDEEPGDLLNLDHPEVTMPSVLTRLALIALGAAAAIFVVSFLLVATVPKGTVFDVIILVTWVGVVVLSIGGFALLAAAGITKVVKSGERA